ncbi:MAG: response regulator receiver modulated serine phosphatase [uncultured Chloroflexi bacterium]|uniref:Response regulator receiver modulated serine phosphatase n=1 Tax=uncultured Chloroflexota bacterium TaxID=166587 RepID=A0A6J4H427_9CHLR|nr:MAG: response regulator receiver modulated serine phosphatase [uncultured Chloroflexota bacterium]
MRVLLVEDNPGDARLFIEALREAATSSALGATIEVTHAGGLHAAFAACRDSAPDVVLLDLGLPETQGLETFQRVRDAAPVLPIVVLSGLDDEQTAIGAVREGAQDYLVKGEVDGRLLERSLRYAIERRRAENEHARLLEEQAARRAAEAALAVERERQERQERELAAIERLSSPPRAAITGQTFGLAALREGAPDLFAGLVEDYARLLDLALEQRGYRVEHDLSGRLRDIAERIGFLAGGPRDVVEVHTTALHQRLRSATPQRAQALVEEARVLVLELMGRLVSYYRSQPPRPSRQSAA